MDLGICRRESVMEEWSLISGQVFSKLIRHYRRRLRAIHLEKEVAKSI